MTLDELTTVTPQSRKECLEKVQGAVLSGGLYHPITDRPTVAFPGTNGGANWGGGSFDPTTGTLYVNSMDVAMFTRMVKRDSDAVLPYRSQGFGRFWDSNLYPCQQPPWGSLTAVDMNKGEFRWRATLGEYDELTARGIPKTGASNLGGSIVTAGGLVFIGATNDSKFRAFDKDTGEELWMTRLPGSAHATPITYLGKSGRQYVAVASGAGNKYNKGFGSKFVVFSLPRDGDPPEPPLITAYPKFRPDYRGTDEKLPVNVAAQPVPFSHKLHAAAKCVDCHTNAATGPRATIPQAGRCMLCHRGVKSDSPLIARIRQFDSQKRAIPWARVYRLPDFVYFSHAKHSGTACAGCHGPVESRDVLSKEVSTSMTACMACHTAKKASTACTACHDLGQ
jgi:hypothetical protein